MKRREFLATGGALAAAPLALAQNTAAPGPPTPSAASAPVRQRRRGQALVQTARCGRTTSPCWPANRFNRFNLSFGIGYDFLREVTDAYLLFAYPFLLDVPGYKVRASGCPDAERDRNLETLRYISEQTAAAGLEFQLGLWMHGYQWENSPNPNYTIED